MTTLRTDSTGYRELYCRTFIDSHIRFDPAALTWPELTGAERERLAALPFWAEAVETERVTARTVQRAARRESDPLLRQAIALQGEEEGRHALLLRDLTRHYAIPLPDAAPLPPERPGDWDFLYAGCGECFDSFFAFGLFEIARRSGYFPPRLIEIFDPIMQEEARHILFFVNWLADRRARLAPWRRPFDRLRLGLIFGLQVWSRVKTAVGMGRGQENFTLRGHQAIDLVLTPAGFLALCMEQNERRFSPYDPRLRRPKLLPGLAKFLLFWLPKGGALTPAG